MPQSGDNRMPKAGYVENLLPWPEAWGSTSARPIIVAVLVFFGFASLVLVSFTVDAAASGNAIGATYGALGVLAGFTFVAIALPSMRVRRKRLPRGILLEESRDGVAGLRFSLVRYWRAVVAVWLVAGTAFMIARAVMVLRQLLTDDADGHGTGAALEVPQLVVAVAAIGAFAFLAVFLFAGRRDNHLTLNHKGLVRVSGPVTKSISWADIARVEPRVVNEMAMVRIVPTPGSAFHIDTGQSRTARWGRARADRQMDLPALAFGIDPALLLYLVQFYQRHPEDRPELESNAVLDRIQSGKLIG